MNHLIVLLLALLVLSGCSTKIIKTPEYILEAGLIIDGRALLNIQKKTRTDTHTILYFEDKEKEAVYKLDAYLTKGELAGTVNIFTRVSTVVTSPSFLVFEGKAATAILPTASPKIGVTVRAIRHSPQP